MKLNNIDLDELDELYGGIEKIGKNGKKNKSRDGKNVEQSQSLPAGWREGDTHIGRQKKRRNRNL
jgi:hypothetical protein